MTIDARKATGILPVFAALVAVLWLGGCSLPAGRAYPIRVSSETVTLSWDPPSKQSAVPGEEISLYYVYVRRHGTAGWRLIREVPASTVPSIRLSITEFGVGEYDFAVASATSTGHESLRHASSDATADPTGGWYLIWYP